MEMERVAGISIQGFYVVQLDGEHGLGNSSRRGFQGQASGDTGFSHDRGLMDEDYVQGALWREAARHSLVRGAGAKEKPWRDPRTRRRTASRNFAPVVD